MKKIAKVLLEGLVLSMVLTVLFPGAFLKDDAKWTYQSDVGRVDVALAGEVRAGQIDIQEKSLRVDRPRWICDGNDNQGVVVQFPVSYLRKTYHMTLTPRGNAKEISLVMRFRGKDFRVRNQRKPAYVRFEEIQVNGKEVAKEQTIWHDNPFQYCVRNISANSSITLGFDIRKPLAFIDIRWERVIGLFMACSLLIFIAYSSLISCSDILKRLVNRLNKKDIIQVIAENYRSIDVVYRRSFWIIFGVLCFAFGFHALQFMWGNHDWKDALPIRDAKAFVWCGRYALHSIKSTVLGCIYLPFIYDVVSFLFLALNAVLLCTYWKLERRVVYFVLCGLILTAQPFTLSLIYYVHMLPETFVGVTSALIALMLAEKIALEKSSCMRKVVFSLLSIILINLSLAMYPVLINTIAVAFVGRLLVESFEWEGSWKQFKSRFILFSIPMICIALGIGLYKFMITFIFPADKNVYNTQTLPLEQLPDRLWILFKQSFHQLYEYPFPFISQGVLWTFLAFTTLIALYICLTGNFKQKIVRLLILGGALFATQTAMIIANEHLLAGRIELFGLVVFETLVMVVAFTKLKKLHNLSVLAATGVVWVSIINDLDCLRVWKLGFDAEKMLWNRVLARMESQKDFDVNRRYKIIQIGMPISLRSRFYKEMESSKRFYGREDSLLSLSYDATWDVFHAYEFYYPTEFRGDHPRPTRPNAPEYKTQLKRLWEVGILDKAQAWPHENGLIVWKDVILFVTDAKLLEECKKQLAKEFPRQPQSTP